MDEVRLPIRWRDTDALGHVNNAVYLTYLAEACRRRLGPFRFVRVELDYRREIAWDDHEVTVAVEVRETAGPRVHLAARIATATGDAAEALAVVELQPAP